MNSNIIPDKYLSRKRLLELFDRAALPAIVVLVALGAFGLGRLSALEEGRKPVVIHPAGNMQEILRPTEASNDFLQAPTSSAPSASTSQPPTGGFVASKNGAKYYTPTCSGASRITDANKVWFATAATAEAAGYTRATNCK